MNAAWLNSQPLNTFGLGELIGLASVEGLAATATADPPILSLIQAVTSTANEAVATAECDLERRRGLAADLTAVALSPPSENAFTVDRAMFSDSGIATATATLFGSFTIPLGAEVEATATGDLIPGRIDLEGSPTTAIAVVADATMFAQRQLSRDVGVNAVAEHVGEIAITGYLFSSVEAVATQVNTYKVNATVIFSAEASAGATQSLAEIWASAPMEGELAFVTAEQSSYLGRYRALECTTSAGIDSFATEASLIRMPLLDADASADATQEASLVRAVATMEADAGVGATHSALPLLVRAQHAADAAVAALANPVTALSTRALDSGAPAVSVADAPDMIVLRWRPLDLLEYESTASADPPAIQSISLLESVVSAVAEQLAVLFTNIENEAPIARTITVLREGDPIIVAKQDTGIMVYGE